MRGSSPWGVCIVAGFATGQRGEKERLLLCNAFKDCASFELVQHRKQGFEVQWNGKPG